MKSISDNIISGTAMAVLIGFGSIASAIFAPYIDLGSRIVLFFMGVFMVWLGLNFSRG